MVASTPRDRPDWRAKADLVRYEPVADTLILAAIERAIRHAQYREDVAASEIAEHLGFLPGAYTTRCLRPRLGALVAEGALETRRRDRHHL